MSEEKLSRFENLTFDRFRLLALDDSLSVHEKVGFPNSYREGKEQAIFDDVVSKLPNLTEKRKLVLEIGPGCGPLPHLMIDLCRRNDHSLVFIDSAEMLAQLPDAPHLRKISGCFPDCLMQAAELRGQVGVVLIYSVLHHVFEESSLIDFLDESLGLLAHGGEMLIGDIPNVSKRKRFFVSPQGVKFHQEFMNTSELPNASQIERGHIDDNVICSLLMRARQQGFDAYVVPQAENLPMANRREDILIRRP